MRSIEARRTAADFARRGLLAVVSALALVSFLPAGVHASSLRFFGNGVAAPDLDRVKIRIDDPSNEDPGPPADVGATDFTIEWWMKASAADNTTGAVACGGNVNWIYGNIVLDRDRYNQGRKFGVSIAGGRLVFGVSTDSADRTVCGSTDVLDDAWHHVAVQRASSGAMSIWVDGALDGSATGPSGDVSYPDDGVPCVNCCPAGPCDGSDPFLVIGAEKHDAGASFPSYAGFFDELRLSTQLRYGAPFVRPTAPFVTDASTAALYHLDEGSGDVIDDSSGRPGGPSDGERRYGGSPAGPEWSPVTPFGAPNDLDGDGKANDVDECTVLVPARQRIAGGILKLDDVDLVTGLQSVQLRGKLGTAGTWPVAPHTDGLHVLVEDAADTVVNVAVPPGLAGSGPCDPRDGWTVGGSSARPLFLYRNFSGFLDAGCTVSAQGLSSVKLKDLGETVAVLVKLDGTGVALALPPTRLQAMVALAAPPTSGGASAAAEAGACAEATWDPVATAAPLPFCKLVPASSGQISRVRCRTSR